MNIGKQERVIEIEPEPTGLPEPEPAAVPADQPEPAPQKVG